MTDHRSKMSAPRVHSPFPAGALDAPQGTNDARLGGANLDRAVEARTKKVMALA